MAAPLLRTRAAPRVLVVGGGPVGLTTAFLLDRVFGVPTRVVERETQPTAHPQAHFLNLRTMEVLLATAPSFHDRLLATAAPSDLVRANSGVCVYESHCQSTTHHCSCASGATTFTALASAARASLRASTSSAPVRLSLSLSLSLAIAGTNTGSSPNQSSSSSSQASRVQRRLSTHSHRSRRRSSCTSHRTASRPC